MEICDAFRNRIFLFMCACFSGILFALVWRKYEQTVHWSLIQHHYSSSLRNSNYERWLRNRGLTVQLLPEEDISFNAKSVHNFESSYLTSNVPVLCLVFVNSQNSANSVKQTWAKHCNIVSFFGKFVDEHIPVMKIPPMSSFEGFCYAFVHIWKKYQDQFEWVIIADDSTFVLVQNLRHFVAPLNSSMNYYLGHPVKDFSNLYNLGSAGIVLSHGCLTVMSSIYESIDDCTSQRPPSWYFDQALGKLLHSYEIHPVDTRDIELKGRFNPFSVEAMLIPGSISVFSSYWRTSVYLSNEGMNCCSDEAITFHDVSPSQMFLFEYILYHLSVFRNSIKGLGNWPPRVDIHRKPFYSKKPKKLTGEAFVQLLDYHNKAATKHSKTKTSFSNHILEEIFEHAVIAKMRIQHVLKRRWSGVSCICFPCPLLPGSISGDCEIGHALEGT